MIIHNCIQGTEEWLKIRAGIPTASEFSTIMAKGKGGAESKTRRAYMLKLIGERLTGELVDTYTNAHMERGKEMEAEARAYYELTTGNIVKQVGFITNDSGTIGYSPDGIGTKLLEIKTKLPHLQLEVLLKDEVPSEHLDQLQGGLWVAEMDSIDFVSFWPKLPTFVKTICRDTLHIKKISEAVEIFMGEMTTLEEKIKRMM